MYDAHLRLALPFPCLTNQRVSVALSPTLWLDKIRAVPSIGIASRGTFDSGGHLLARLKPLLARWSSEHREVKVHIEDHMLVKIERTDGINVHVSHQNIFCKFFYITDVIDKGGEAPPLVEVRSPSVSYAELLDRVTQTVREVSTELYRDGNRVVGRIGIVAEGNVDLSALPPGIERYFRHLSSPWGGFGLELTGALIATLAANSGYTDKCHHHFTKGLDEAQAMPMRLDWQRFFEPAISPSVTRLMESIADCSNSASEYFGRFGIGDLNYGG